MENGPFLTPLEEGYLELYDLAELNGALLEQLTSSPRDKMQPGPPLTAAEKESIPQDPPAPIPDTVGPPSPMEVQLENYHGWLEDLHDKSNAARWQILEFLRDALSGPALLDEAASSSLESRLLEICLGNPLLLSEMLRTPFLNDEQTPLVWAITNLPWDMFRAPLTPRGLPSLLHLLLTWSVRGLERTAETSRVYDAAGEACCRTNANWLFQYFNIRAHALPELPFGYCLTQTDYTEFAFTIYDFEACMVRLGCVDLRLMLQGKIFSISIVAADTGWSIVSKVVAEREATPLDHYETLNLVALRSTKSAKEACLFRLDIESLDKSCPPRTTSAQSLQNGWNDFVRPNGLMKGYLRFRRECPVHRGRYRCRCIELKG
ncbi:hypothetical protein BKA70DRAFT_1287444 [Coprinopsis sp. MPI-PUGE-AT-0042]|nr:hypothetical protein BKA70DRAFT_1287444 [Coprinopsis sp. MPI-PUGE-AT-0042]